MRSKLVKIALYGFIGFFITCALLAMVTSTVLLPALAVTGLVVLAGIAAFLPKRGVPFLVALIAIGLACGASMFAISSAYSVVPQSSGLLLIPAVVAVVACGLLVLFGNRGSAQSSVQ